MTLLPNPEFLNWFLGAIADARASIVIVNYLATLDEGDKKSPVAQIVAALILAVKRGVCVLLILEGSKFKENYFFYRTLKDGGADVWMDTSLTFIHTKAILVDDKTLCVGSHNISNNALTRHEEMSLTTEDVDAIAGFKTELEKMTSQRRAIASAICKEGTSLPLSIIPMLTKIKRSIAPHAYMLYLLLCKLDHGQPKEITVDAESFAKEIALPPSTASADVRITTMLEMMDKKLGVVRFDNGKVCRGAVAAPIEGGETPPLQIPTTFWSFGWSTRLSTHAIHLHLAGEAEKLESPFKPWWRLKRDDIATKYGFQKQLVNRTQMELKKFGLLEILFEVADKLPVGRYARYMNYFRQNPFYDYDARMAQIENLSKKYPAKIFAVAQKLLSIVGDDSDAQKLESLCNRITNVGPEKTEIVAKEVSNLSPNSTKRTFEYVEERVGKKNKFL